MVECRDVCAGYDGKEVLHHVNLTFSPGKVTVLVGPNGCGKSTLLKTLVRLNLPQSRNVPDITALCMVLHGRFPYLSYPRRYRREDMEKAREALCWVGMEDFAEQNVNRLSGGNQQKVYIAMALAQDTPVILMDEPTTYLDISHQLKLMSLAKRLAEEGKEVVLVLHDLSLALQTADEVAVLSQGNLVKCGSCEEIYKSGILDEVFGVKVRRIETENGWKYYYESN